jgi:hypothetical protein
MVAILLNSTFLACALLAAAGPAPDDAAELREMQQRLLSAVIEGRRDDYAAMLAPEWRVTYADGTVRTRSEVLEQVFGGPKPLVRSGRVEVDDVSVVADMAVVRGRTEAVPREGDTVRLRFVDVAFKRNGRWLITSSFATLTKEDSGRLKPNQKSEIKNQQSQIKMATPASSRGRAACAVACRAS